MLRRSSNRRPRPCPAPKPSHGRWEFCHPPELRRPLLHPSDRNGGLVRWSMTRTGPGARPRRRNGAQVAGEDRDNVEWQVLPGEQVQTWLDPGAAATPRQPPSGSGDEFHTGRRGDGRARAPRRRGPRSGSQPTTPAIHGRVTAAASIVSVSTSELAAWTRIVASIPAATSSGASSSAVIVRWIAASAAVGHAYRPVDRSQSAVVGVDPQGH